jgi:hypothetical protein
MPPKPCQTLALVMTGRRTGQSAQCNCQADHPVEVAQIDLLLLQLRIAVAGDARQRRTNDPTSLRDWRRDASPGTRSNHRRRNRVGRTCRRSSPSRRRRRGSAQSRICGRVVPAALAQLAVAGGGPPLVGDTYRACQDLRDARSSNDKSRCIIGSLPWPIYLCTM